MSKAEREACKTKICLMLGRPPEAQLVEYYCCVLSKYGSLDVHTVTLSLDKNKCKPCRVKGSSCNENTGGH